MSGSSKQKDAVFSAIASVLAEAGITPNEGESFATVLNKELRAQVTNILVEGFKNGTIDLKEGYETEAELRTYASGVTSNWLRKDPRMNGGIKYQPKNPGSRVGSSDPTIKSMRALLATRTDLTGDDRAEIQAAINQRVSEVRATKRPAKELTADQIELLRSAGLSQFLPA